MVFQTKDSREQLTSERLNQQKAGLNTLCMPVHGLSGINKCESCGLVLPDCLFIYSARVHALT